MASGANYRLFWQEFRRTFHSTGAVLPSGPRLCAELAQYVRGEGSQRRILEVGPGTGVATDKIIARLGATDSLDLCELNDRFVEVLRDRLAGEPAWQAVSSRVRIHHKPVEDLDAAEPYDAIVSGLPLNNFDVTVVESILTRLAKLAKPGGTLSFFEYVGVRKAKAPFVSQAERKRLAGVGAAVGDACRNWEFDRRCVLANVPPAWVHHLRFA